MMAPRNNSSNAPRAKDCTPQYLRPRLRSLLQPRCIPDLSVSTLFLLPALPLAQPHAFADQPLFGVREILRSREEPTFRFGERRASEQVTGILAVLLPLSHLNLYALSPKQELAVLVQPAAQPFPVPNQSFVRHLNR